VLLVSLHAGSGKKKAWCQQGKDVDVFKQRKGMASFKDFLIINLDEVVIENGFFAV